MKNAKGDTVLAYTVIQLALSRIEHYDNYDPFLCIVTPVVYPYRGHIEQVYPVPRPSCHEVAGGHDFGQQRTEAHGTAT
jgi:hypothetical protein